MNRYFFKYASGLNADIERHRAKEKDLRMKIESLASATDAMSIASLKAYQNSLNHLIESKANLTSKIGKNKTTPLTPLLTKRAPLGVSF